MQPDIRQRTIRTIGNRIDSEEDLREGGPGREVTPLSPAAPSGEAAKADRRLEAAAPSKSNGGSELFDALLMAAAGGRFSYFQAVSGIHEPAHAFVAVFRNPGLILPVLLFRATVIRAPIVCGKPVHT